MPDATALTKDGPLRLHDNGDGTFSVAAYLSGQSSSIGGGTSSGGGSIYSNTRGDFTATPTNGAKTITLASFINSNISAATLLATNFVNGAVLKVDTNGVVTRLPLTTVIYNSGTGVLTLSDMTANFASGDAVEVTLVGPDKAFDEANDQSKVTQNTRIAGENLTTDRLQVEQVFTPTNITTNATTTVKTGAGLLHSININNPSAITVAALTLTIYDNTAASGTKIGTVVVPVDTTAKPFPIPFNTSFATGLTVVTAGPTVTADITVNWR